MTEHPLKLAEIVSWYRLKQRALLGSAVALVDTRERTEYTAAAAANFDGVGSLGEITGWVSGEFDFHVLRVSDGKDIFWRHFNVASLSELEATYSDFLKSLNDPVRGD